MRTHDVSLILHRTRLKQDSKGLDSTQIVQNPISRLSPLPQLDYKRLKRTYHCDVTSSEKVISHKREKVIQFKVFTRLEKGVLIHD
jgi:hypothetical protein